MKKKIFISEDQYRRIFLNEQGGKKGAKINKSMGALAAPPNTFDRYGIKPQLSIDKLFDVHIKNKGDGDNFRKWVRSDSKRLAKVTAEFRKKGLSGTLDATGAYDNEYMKIAWGVVGQSYLSSNKGKGWEGVDDYAGMDVQHPKFVVGQNVGYESKINKIYNDRPEYQNYLSAMKNWSSVSSYFGWTNAKSVSSEKLEDILGGKVALSTCIDPTYVLQMMDEKNIAMRNSLVNQGVAWDQIDGIMGQIRFTWGEVYDELPEPIKPIQAPKMVDPSLFDDQGKQPIDYSGGLGPSYYSRLATVQGFNAASDMGFKKAKEKYTSDVKTKQELDKLGQDFKENLIDYNIYKAVINIINIQNINISYQTIKRYENACSNPVYKTIELPRAGIEMELGASAERVDETFTWKQACTKNGGVYMLPMENVKKEGGKTSIGIIGGKVTCCCVNPKGTADVIVNGLNGDYSAKINIEEWCKKSQGDVRSGLEKFAQWGGECASDWHCIADIASIAVLALGPGGILLSGIIDAVSAVGYVVEQDEGWELNAGLTILGSFGGVGEAFGLLKQGSKFTSKLSKLTTELKLVSGDPILSRSILRDFAKTLSPEEAKQFRNFGRVSTSESVINKFGTGGAFTNEFNKLSKIQKGVFSDMLKKETPENLEKLFKNSGKDLNKMVNGYVKGTKQVILQGVLFAGMYVYSDELGLFLKDIYDKYGFDPLGIFDSNGNLNLENEKLKNIDFNRIISKKEIVKYFKPKGSNSVYKSKFTEVSAKYSEIFLLSLKKLIGYKEEQDLLKKLDPYYKRLC
jgi:hypothetical protein